MYIIDLLLKCIDKVTGKAKFQAGDGDIAALGVLADLAKTDPTQAASVISSLKGILKQLQGSGTGALPTQLTGSDMELYGKTLDDRPAANTMKAGTTFTIVDAILDQNWISDGTDWLEV